MERWIEIKEFKGYEVSNKGNVKSLNYKNTGKERLLKLHQHSTGYTKTTLYRGKGYTHIKVIWFPKDASAAYDAEKNRNKPKVQQIAERKEQAALLRSGDKAAKAGKILALKLENGR